MSHALKRRLVAALSTVLCPPSDQEFTVALNTSRTMLANHNQGLADIMNADPVPTQGSAQVQALTDQIMSLRAREARLCEDLHRANTMIQQQALQVEETRKFMASMSDFQAKFDQIADQCSYLAGRLHEAEQDLTMARKREARALAMAARHLPAAA